MNKHAVIEKMRGGEFPRGLCLHGVWRWDFQGESCTRAVNVLLKSGEVEAIYFSGGNASLQLAQNMEVNR